MAGLAPAAQARTRAGADERRGLAEVEWRSFAARSGEPTLELAGHAVHSAYAPGREAEGLAREAASALERSGADLVVLLGTGLGLLPPALDRAARAELLTYEPFPEVANELRAAGVAAEPARRPVTRPEELERALDLALARGRRPHVIVHPGYTEICRFERRLVARALRRSGGGPALTPDRAVVSPRALDALVRWPRLGSLAELAGACAERTALLVAPGPSLEAALPTLARRRGGVLFAAIQALRPLQEAGVRVDFAVAPDPLHSTPFVADFEPAFGALLAEAGVEPALLDRFAERCFLFALRSLQLYDLAWSAAGEAPWDEPMNTVSETMLLLAHRLGARRIALVGIDLCGREKGEFSARRASGTPQLTNPGYWHAARYLSWRCPQLAREGCQLLRVGDGLPIAGTEPLDVGDLADLMDEEDPLALPVPRAPGCDPARRDIAAALLREAAAKACAAAVPGGAAPGVDPTNRWSPFAPLPEAKRRAACLEGLRALDEASTSAP